MILRRGQLSKLGVTEHRELAKRLEKRISPLFSRALYGRTHNRIQVLSSGKTRTYSSLQSFLNGLSRVSPNVIDYDSSINNLLSFHEDPTYQAYFRKDKQLKNKLRSIYSQAKSKKLARDVLERLFDSWFIDKLARGEYSFFHNESEKYIKNEIDAVRMIHSLYLIGPNLREEGVGNLFEKYFNADESIWFAYLHDAKVSTYRDFAHLHSMNKQNKLKFSFFFRNSMKKALRLVMKH